MVCSFWKWKGVHVMAEFSERLLPSFLLNVVLAFGCSSASSLSFSLCDIKSNLQPPLTKVLWCNGEDLPERLFRLWMLCTELGATRFSFLLLNSMWKPLLLQHFQCLFHSCCSKELIFFVCAWHAVVYKEQQVANKTSGPHTQCTKCFAASWVERCVRDESFEWKCVPQVFPRGFLQEDNTARSPAEVSWYQCTQHKK